MQRIARKHKKENTRHSHDGLVRFMTLTPQSHETEQNGWSIAEQANGRRYKLYRSYRSPEAQSFQARQYFIAEIGEFIDIVDEGDGRPDETGGADFRQLRRHIVRITDQRIHAVTAQKSLPEKLERLRRERLRVKPLQLHQV